MRYNIAEVMVVLDEVFSDEFQVGYSDRVVDENLGFGFLESEAEGIWAG